MPLERPYRRVVRPFGKPSHPDFEYARGESYVKHPEWARDRLDLVQAYRLLEQDLLKVFDYVHPHQVNVRVFSHRLYELLLRACTEFEANAKGMLIANAYRLPDKKKWFDVRDYRRLEEVCRLSEYEVKLHIWTNAATVFRPFKAWGAAGTLHWYEAYNDVKHARSENFTQANLQNVMDAVTGVLVILFAQFYVQAFDPYRIVNQYEKDKAGYYGHQVSVFHVRPPANWPEAEKYDFNWDDLRSSGGELFANFWEP